MVETVEQEDRTREQALMRIGAVCAVLGAVVSVAAGIGFGGLPAGADARATADYLAARPGWYWPAVHLGFMTGAVLWVWAFAALARSLREGTAGALGQLAWATVILGAAVHVVHSSLSAFGLPALAGAWEADPTRLGVVEAPLRVLEGAWAGVITWFHGAPFVLMGLAVALSRRYPAWLGWVGVLGGLGSLVLGVLMFLGVDAVPEGLYVPFAVIVSLWMVAMGVLMWPRAERAAETFRSRAPA